MKMPYCSKCTIGEDRAPSHTITSRQRLARVIVGLGWLSLAWVFLGVPIRAIAWPTVIIAVWFGASHVVAGWIGYPDCPELGVIASVFRSSVYLDAMRSMGAGSLVRTAKLNLALLFDWSEPKLALPPLYAFSAVDRLTQ